jgi:hemerythrin
MFNSTTANTCVSPCISWTEELAIGYEPIDEDHRAIFATADRLQADMAEEPEHSIVGQVLVELIEHTGGHFLREEVLMRAVGFPEYEQHRLQHQLMMQAVNSLHRRFMDGRRNISADVAEFLQKALVPHILKADAQLGRFMREDR